jgi:hypothetical protein
MKRAPKKKSAARLVAAGVLAAGLVASIPSHSWAVSYYLVPDVPSTLGGLEFGAGTIVRSDNAVYSLAVPAENVLALYRRPDGFFLASPEIPVDIGAPTFLQPRDVALVDPVTFAATVVLDGGAAGIPDGVRIDALLLDPAGNLVLSFDVPVTLGGVSYTPADLVTYKAGSFSLYWDAEAAGVPPHTNVVGADRDSAGTLVVDFDVPLSLGGTEYLPGQLVRWTGAGFATYFVDPAWPPASQTHDFAFVPAAGAVPDSGATPGVPLTVSLAAGSLTLSWGSSCATSDTDYEVYEGTLGTYYSHASKLCTTGGATTATIAAPVTSTYYLVVPKNAVSEGSYGQASGGAEVPPGASACLPQVIALACP